MRFNFDANTVDEATDYLKARSKQLLRFGFKLDQIISPDNGVVISYFIKNNVSYQSIFILNDWRGKGLYKNWITHTILTSDDCKISDYLSKNDIKFISVNLYEWEEYRIISDFYGGKIANRSGVQLMNHIDEGLFILEKIRASDIAKKAYCLHPIVQDDESLKNNKSLLKDISSDVIISSIEYRSVANEYLSKRNINSIDEIRLSPLKDVNDMLIADKIQNRKDFELYHLGKHDRSFELDQYFKNWLKKLEISEDEYQYFKKHLI
jgi:hypothetical protein